MENRNHRLWIRLTEEELLSIKAKSSDYKSVAAYIRDAINEYSNVDAKKKFAALNELSSLCKLYQNELSSLGGNLNQAMKRANELSIAGILTKPYIDNTLIPYIKQTHDLCMTLKRDIDSITHYVLH